MDSKDTIDICLDAIMIDEGFNDRPYKCPAGKLTIGFGRNLEDQGITRAEAKMLLLNDITRAMTFLEGFFPKQWAGFSSARQCALINMVVNLGPGGFQKFRKMIKHITFGEWSLAANEALASLWAHQVGKRAVRIAQLLEAG